MTRTSTAGPVARLPEGGLPGDTERSPRVVARWRRVRPSGAATSSCSTMPSGRGLPATGSNVTASGSCDATPSRVVSWPDTCAWIRSTIAIRPGAGADRSSIRRAASRSTSSQADDLTMVAVAQGRRVGVDVERLRHIGDAAEIADALFTPREAELLRSMSPASRSRAFLTLWTRKESLVKAIGGGLSMPLDSFTVLTRGRHGRASHTALSGPCHSPLRHSTVHPATSAPPPSPAHGSPSDTMDAAESIV